MSNTITKLLNDLNQKAISRVTAPYDQAFLDYRPVSQVTDFDQFQYCIADFYNYLYSRAVSQGVTFSESEAWSKAKIALENVGRRENKNINSMYEDAKDGSMRDVLGHIVDFFKYQKSEEYVQQVFDKFIKPVSWSEKVQTIKEFIDICGPHLSPSIRADQSERFAHDYQTLIRSYVNALNQMANNFRRL